MGMCPQSIQGLLVRTHWEREQDVAGEGPTRRWGSNFWDKRPCSAPGDQQRVAEFPELLQGHPALLQETALAAVWGQRRESQEINLQFKVTLRHLQRGF